MPVVNHIVQVLDTCEDEALRGRIGTAHMQYGDSDSASGEYVVMFMSRLHWSDTRRVLCCDCRILITGDDLAALANTIAREVPHATPT